LSKLKGSNIDTGIIVRTALTNVMGEMPSTIVVAYTGDTSDGDFQGFAQRMDELLGDAAPVMLSNIVSLANKEARGPLVGEGRGT
jgi:hypothetical protein